jgi:butyrate kinase
VPSYALAKLCFEGDCSENEVERMLVGKGGYVSYLGTNDGRVVSKMVEEGNKEAALVQDALAYQVSKEIGANAAVLCGEVDAIILTGGLAYNKDITDYIAEHVSFIAPVTLYPGENEMEALNEGGQRVLRGEEDAKEYTSY